MRKKFGDWILDIAKYLVTVGIVAPALKLGDETSLAYYTVMIGVVICMVGYGFYLSNDSEQSKNKKKKK